MLGKAIAIASEAFKDKKDKGGEPYILHCLYVMNKVKHLGNDVMIAGVLHDLLEDCSDWNIQRLFSEGFNEDIVSLISILTHDKDEDYMTYIKKISFFKEARQVKLADLEHNSQITRLKGISKKDFDKLEKYCIAYEYLKKV